MSPAYRIDFSDEVGKLEPNTAAEIHAASLTICDRATDVDDARELLEAVGIR